MIFCTKCGKPLVEGASFCAACGTPKAARASRDSTRKTVYDGEIHKCPNCGEVLKYTAMVCPACNYELRGTNSSTSIKNLELKLERATSEKQRILIIKNYPIPNTKEDLFEFMILAASNFDADYYATHLNEEDSSDAWLVKVEQCYQKAKWMLSDKSEKAKFESIYNKIIYSCESSKEQEKQKEINRINRFKKAKSKAMLQRLIIISLLVLIPVTLIIGGVFIYEAANEGKIEIGISSDDCEGRYYEDIVELFEGKGFTNVESREDGWHLFYGSGTVKSVTIDGIDDFSSSSRFNPDVKIIIFYYE